LPQVEAGVKGGVAHGIDHDLFEAGLQALKNGMQQIVYQTQLRGRAVELEKDCNAFRDADKKRQNPFDVLFG
jgi:hypothetical protein